MTKVKVSEATRLQLDWMVDKAEGRNGLLGNYSPSTDWSQGGPIIEREGINCSVNYQDDALGQVMFRAGWKANLWNNSVPGTSGFLKWAYGDTMLIAAMRVYVMTRLGDEVEVPEELLT